MEVDTQTMLLACIADRLGVIAWLQSADGAKGRNRPQSIVDAFLPKSAGKGFASVEEFWAARERILRGENQDGN